MNAHSEIHAPLKLVSRQNCSLSPVGRRFFLGLLGFNLLAVGLWFTFIGAWLVLPFAGLEFLLVCLAFKLISQRAEDYETLTVADFVLAFESQIKGSKNSFECNARWARLYCLTRLKGNRCELSLRYAGKQVTVGRLLNDEQRMVWAATLQRQLKVVHAAL
jgi:uncharacterized membrane protein